MLFINIDLPFALYRMCSTILRNYLKGRFGLDVKIGRVSILGSKSQTKTWVFQRSEACGCRLISCLLVDCHRSRLSRFSQASEPRGEGSELKNRGDIGERAR